MVQHPNVSKKMSGPMLSPYTLHREEQVKQLNEILTGKSSSQNRLFSHYKLVIFCTPAGYGKTTFLADFAQHTNLPCCWYFLDQSDIDRTTFLTFFIRSIQYRFPAFGKELEPLLCNAVIANSDPLSHATFEAIIDALVAALNAEIPDRFVFSFVIITK
jgi:ATP/maltotriose-dependent transcriptional regulator MalT